MKISKLGVIVTSAVLFVPVAAHAGCTIYEDRAKAMLKKVGVVEFHRLLEQI